MTIQALVLAGTLFAGAQTLPGDTLSLGEVTVTAIKQSADLRTQATSITVLDRAVTERNGVLAIKDAAQLVPNLFIPDYGSRMTSTVYVRGIGTRIDQPAVGLTVDNVPVLTKENYDLDMLDITRVEMLRGPQSTLYGRNTMGGLINVYTLSPLNYQGTRLVAEGATQGSWRVGASHYARLGSGVGVSLAVHGGGKRGEFVNEYNGKRCDWERALGVRGKVEWRGGGWYVANVLSLGVSRQGGYPYEWLETGQIAYNDTCYYRRTSLMDGLTVRKQLPGFSLSSITSYQLIDDDMTLDQDFTPMPYFTLTQQRREHAVTQDVVARSDVHADDGYAWLLGLSGFFRRYRMDAPVTFLDYGIEQLIENHVNEAIPQYPIAWDTRTFELGSHFTSPNWGAAIYHESTWTLGQWTLQAGVRLDYEHARLNYRSVTHTGYNIMQQSTGTTYAHENVDIDDSGTLDKDFVEVLPRLSATWHPWPGKRHTVYVSVARGSKAGGFNTQMFSDVLQQRLMNMMGIGARYDVDRVVGYKPERAWNYEIGGHFECWQGRVQSDMGVFVMDCRDRQLTVFPDGVTTGRLMTNAGRTTSWGTEFAMTVTPTDVTRLSVSYGFTRATFGDYNDGKADYSGKRVPYAPAHTLFAEASHGVPMGPNREKMLTFAVNLRAVGDIWWDEANTLHQPLYALVGANVTWQQPHGSLQLWGTNLTGTRYNTFYFVSVQHPFLQRGHGRQVGLTLRINL